MDFATSLIQTIVSRRHFVQHPRCVDTYLFAPPNQYGCYDPQRALSLIEFVATEASALNEAAARWSDDPSRDWMHLLYAFRALGPNHIRLPTDRPEYWQRYAAATALRTGAGSHRLGDQTLDLFTVEHAGETIEIECLPHHVAFSFLGQQYVLVRGSLDLRPRLGDVVIDGGAFVGDSALAFAAAVGPDGRVFSFDPMDGHSDIFLANLARNPALADRISLTKAALDDQSGKVLSFADIGPASRPAEDGGEKAVTISIDDFVRERQLSRVDFIKMDIEGGELGALIGAVNTIRRFSPVLAISGYHKLEDLVVLPSTIHAIDPGYELYLEHYTVHQDESVIFARPSTPRA